jgi:nucleoside-diphosphate-sugar epimerase
VILVTGASGYLGRELVAYLRRQNLRVLTADRRRGLDQHITIDLENEVPWSAHLQGVETIIHCAGIAHREGSPNDYQRINQQATLHLAEAARVQGVKHFIFLSSIHVLPIGLADPTASAIEWIRPQPPYAASKWSAELDLEARLDGDAMRLSIVRPALMYDRDTVANLRTLVSLAQRLPLRFPPLGQRSMVARPDVVHFLGHLAQSAPTSDAVGRYTLTDGESYHLERMARVFGPGLRIPLPLWFWRGGAACLDVLQSHRSGATWGIASSTSWCGTVSRQPSWNPEWTLETLCSRGSA